MIVLIDNYDSFTYNVYQALAKITNEEIRVLRSKECTIADIEALNPSRLIVSPGPGRPEDAGISVEAIKHFAGKLPILGVCLGHQAIGYAFGAKIVGAKFIKHGIVEESTPTARACSAPSARRIPLLVTTAWSSTNPPSRQNSK